MAKGWRGLVRVHEGHIFAIGTLHQQLRIASQFCRNDIISRASGSDIQLRKTLDARDFIHCTSSPRYPHNHGKAERTVQNVQSMLKKSVDPYGALLAYRTTSLECGYSPAQLLMGRQLRTSIPVVASTLQPRWEESKQPRARQENIKTRQRVDYDANIGSTVVGKAGTPRSYVIQTPTTFLRWNRRHLVSTPNVTIEPILTENRVTEDSDVVQPSQASPSVVCTSPVPPRTVTTVRRSGLTSVPPQRLDL